MRRILYEPFLYRFGSVVQVEYNSGRPDALWFLGASFQNRSFQTQKTAAHTQFLTQGFFWCHLNIETPGAESRHRLEVVFHRERSAHHHQILGSSVPRFLKSTFSIIRPYSPVL